MPGSIVPLAIFRTWFLSVFFCEPSFEAFPKLESHFSQENTRLTCLKSMCSFSFFSLEDSNVHIVQEPMLLQKRQLKTSLFSFAKQQFSVPNNSPPLRTATLVENETIQGQIGEGCPVVPVQMEGTTRPAPRWCKTPVVLSSFLCWLMMSNINSVQVFGGHNSHLKFCPDQFDGHQSLHPGLIN